MRIALTVPGLSLFIAAGLLASAAAASEPVPGAVLAPVAGDAALALPSEEAEPLMKRGRFMLIDEAALFAGDEHGRPGPAAVFPLFDDVTVRAEHRAADLGIGDTPLWLGEIDGEPGGFALVVSVDGFISGRVFIPSRGYFELQGVSPGVVLVKEVSMDGVNRCAVDHRQLDEAAPGHFIPPAERRGVIDLATAQRDIATGGFTFADVLVPYTPAARINLGGTPQMLSWINAEIATTNMAYQNSQVSLRVRLAGAVEVAYTQHPTNMGTDLNLITTQNNGVMDEVHPLRNQLGADLVALIVHGPTNACGIAWLMTGVGPSFQSLAFSVTARTCSGFVLAHELGHNMGLAHDRDNAGAASHPFAYGYRAPGAQFRTVMAYSPGGWIPHFSNPDVLVNGLPTGNPINHATNPCHNALALNLNASTVAAWRTLFTQPPSSFDLMTPGEGVTTATRAPTFTWQPSDQADYYRLEVSASPSFQTTLINAAPLTAAFFTPQTTPPMVLQTGTQYYWRVTATNPLGSASSNPTVGSFFTPSNPPGAFSLTTPASGAQNVSRNPTLVWLASVDTDGYRVIVDENPSFSSPVFDVSGITAMSYTWLGTPLTPDTVYYWKVISSNNIGSVESSQVFSFRTIGTPPGPFNLVSPADGAFIQTRTPLLTWTSSLFADSYRVVVDDDQSFSTPEVDIAGLTETSHQVPEGALLNNTRYYWKVIAQNSLSTTTAAPPVATFAVVVPFCLGDANGDGLVNFSDISSVLANWGTAGPLGDANNDGQVNFVDISTVLGVWGFVCP